MTRPEENGPDNRRASLHPSVDASLHAEEARAFSGPEMMTSFLRQAYVGQLVTRALEVKWILAELGRSFSQPGISTQNGQKSTESLCVEIALQLWREYSELRRGCHPCLPRLHLGSTLVHRRAVCRTLAEGRRSRRFVAAVAEPREGADRCRRESARWKSSTLPARSLVNGYLFQQPAKWNAHTNSCRAGRA